MLHKAPVALAAASGLFVVGVLVYTANNRLGGPVQGSVTPAVSSMSSSEPDSPVGWFDEVTLAPVADPSMGGSVGGVTGGTTGGVTGSTGDTGGTTGGAVTCEKQTKNVNEKSQNKNPACTCGKDGNKLKTTFETNVTNQKKAKCKNTNGPSCKDGCDKDGDATVKNEVGVNFVGETIDGGLKPCKKTEVRFCVASWSYSCDIDQNCKAKSSSSSSGTPPPPPPPPPTSTSSYPTSGFKCCGRNTSNATCMIASTSCPNSTTSDGTTYSGNNCNNTCFPTVSSASSMH